MMRGAGRIHRVMITNEANVSRQITERTTGRHWSTVHDRDSCKSKAYRAVLTEMWKKNTSETDGGGARVRNRRTGGAAAESTRR